MQLKKLNEKGIGLVETIIALGVAVIVITSLVSLSVYTLRTSNRGKLYLQGSKQANEGLELVRAFRDQQPTWNDVIVAFQNCDNGALCHISTSGSSLSPRPGEFINTNGTTATADDVFWYFTARGSGSNITATDNVIRIQVRSRWFVGDDEVDAYVYTDLSNWRNR